MPRDRLSDAAPARGQPIGDAEQRDVDLHGLAGAQVAVDRAAAERHLVDEEAEAQVVAGQRRDVLAQPLAGAQPRERRGRDLAPAASWPMNVTRPSAVTLRVCGLATS